MPHDEPINSVAYDVGDYLVVLDDDPGVKLRLKRILRLNTLHFADLNKLSERAPKLSPRAAFVDVYLGGESLGVDLIPKLRKLWPGTALFVITSSPSGQLVQDALAGGADDFICKPLNPEEVLARFHHRVREKYEKLGSRVLRVANLSLDLETYEISGSLGNASLSRTCCQILRTLIEASETRVSKEVLKRRGWGKISVSHNTVERRISELRSSLKSCSGRLSIESFYKAGYALHKSANKL